MTPAPMRRTSDSDTSQTISSLRVRSPTAASLRPPSLRAPFRSVLLARSAGTAPARTPVTSEAPSTNSTTRKSIAISSARGIWSASRAAAPVSISRASRRPAAPPASASSTASMKSCWNTRPRPAPSAARIAISLRRPNALARRRLPTLAHAMSRTSATAPSSISKVVRMSPTITSCNGTTVAPHPALACGYSRSSRDEIRSISDWARRTSTPGLRRAITWAL